MSTMTLLDRARQALAETWTPRPAAPTEVNELRRLIEVVLCDADTEERREALAAACSDVDAALECFRLLASLGRAADP